MLLEKSLEKKNNKYMVGFDLGDRDAQISYCSLQQTEAESVPAVAGTRQYNIPTVLWKRRSMNQWFFGREALGMSDADGGFYIENLFSGAVENRKAVIEGAEYEYLTLLTLFVKKCFGLFSAIAPLDKIEILMFTAEEHDDGVIEVVKKIVDALGLKNTKVFFQSHEESYYYYLLHQAPEFRKGGSVILELEETLKYYLLEWNRRTTPIVSYVVKQKFPDCPQPVWESDETGRKRQMEELDDQVFEKVVKIFQNRMITSVFLIGSGFQIDWADKSLKYMCHGRRVFKGNNLYSKGAAYSALEKFCPTKEGREHIFLGGEKLKANIGLQIIREGQEAYLALLDAGINWYEASCEKEFYLESGRGYQVTLTPLTNVFPEKEAAGKYPVRYERVELPGLPERPEGATRLRIFMELKSPEILHIRTVDLGFGMIYPSAGNVWEQDIIL